VVGWVTVGWGVGWEVVWRSSDRAGWRADRRRRKGEDRSPRRAKPACVTPVVFPVADLTTACVSLDREVRGKRRF